MIDPDNDTRTKPARSAMGIHARERNISRHIGRLSTRLPMAQGEQADAD